MKFIRLREGSGLVYFVMYKSKQRNIKQHVSFREIILAPERVLINLIAHIFRY